MNTFQLTVERRLRQLGLEGKLAWCTLIDGALQLQDEKNHIVRISIDDIARIRIGFTDSKWRMYHSRVWLNSQEKPLELVPLSNSWRAYRQTIRSLTQLLAERQRLDRIETGTSKFDALIGPVLLALLTAGALFVALFVTTNEPWWGRMIIPIVPTVLLALLVWYGKNRYWPRTISHLDDVNPQLPPA